MEKQLIICIGREFGSGGHAIGEQIAETFGIPLYDKEILQDIAEANHFDIDRLKQYDEKPKKSGFRSRTVRGYSTAKEQVLADLQAKFLTDKAKAGESFVIIGRRGGYLLREFPGVIRIFITGEEEAKVKRIMNRNNIGETEAKKLIITTDRKRKVYHNSNAETRWGDARAYDITMNSTPLGIDGTARFLEEYIRLRMEEK